MHRKLCTGGKLNEACHFGAGLGGTDSREDDELAEIELTYSILDDINQARAALGRPNVCIIQVKGTSSTGSELQRRRHFHVTPEVFSPPARDTVHAANRVTAGSSRDREGNSKTGEDCLDVQTM